MKISFYLKGMQAWNKSNDFHSISCLNFKSNVYSSFVLQ